MKLFMTGGTGFLGEHLTQEFRQAGHAVTVLSRRPGTAVRGSLAEISAWSAALEGHDVLVHNAIWWDETPTEGDLRDVRATSELLEAAAHHGIRQVLYTSSVAVHRPFRAGGTEADALTPTDLYAATKACNEMMLHAQGARFGLKVQIMRPGPVVGVPAGIAPLKCDRRIEAIVRAIVARRPVSISPGEGRQFVAARDVARLAGALLRLDAPAGTFLAIDRRPLTYEFIARLAMEIVGIEVPIEKADPKPAPALDPAKIRDHFGFEFDATAALRDQLQLMLA